MNPEYVFSSESTTVGHPDKLCDQISDGIVDAWLRQDPLARVVAECAISTGIVFVSVKHASAAVVDVPNLARDVIRQVGYAGPGFDALGCSVMTALQDLGPAARLDGTALAEGDLDAIPAVDQATVFGFACRDSPALMPVPIWLAHKLARRLDEVRRDRPEALLEPDGKVQVAVEFDGRRPRRVHDLTVLTSQLTHERPSRDERRAQVIEEVVRPAFDAEEVTPDALTRIAVDPEGPIVPGGPYVHAGLTGRKTGVDTYGEFARHGSAALSGKDPSRVDRIGAYAARHAAKCVVAAGLAERCEVAITYAVGRARPVSVRVETFATGKIGERELRARIERTFDFRPAAILRRFGLRALPARSPDGFFRRLAAYGQVGRTDLALPWEDTASADALR